MFLTAAPVVQTLGLPVNWHSNCVTPGDKLWCHFAVRTGFDSIQVVDPFPGRLPELVLCTAGSCGSETITAACPPGVDLRYTERQHNCSCLPPMQQHGPAELRPCLAGVGQADPHATAGGA